MVRPLLCGHRLNIAIDTCDLGFDGVAIRDQGIATPPQTHATDAESRSTRKQRV
jgi:hypothetical protein